MLRVLGVVVGGLEINNERYTIFLGSPSASYFMNLPTVVSPLRWEGL